jgi:hypothetical protein
MKLSMFGDKQILIVDAPTLPNEAANKAYVDSSIAAHASDFTLHLTASQNTLLDGITVGFTEINYLTGLTTNVQSGLDSKLNLSGGTLTGALILASDPTVALGAATKGYVDSGLAGVLPLSGGTLTGALNLATDPTTPNQAATKNYVDNQDNLRVSKAGDTMSGLLVLSGDPAAPLGASTKQYTDAGDALKVSKAGDTMTGPLVLSSDPTVALGAATKGYVDSGLALKLDASANAVSATKLQTARNINGTPFDGTSDITTNEWGITRAFTIGGTSHNVNGTADVSWSVTDIVGYTPANKAGDTFTGNITLADGFTVFVNKVPAGNTELTNKAYVDSLFASRDFKDPVIDSNLVNDSLSTPPTTPVVGDTYIVGAGATDAWAGKEGYATFYNGTSWIFLSNRPVAIGDRYGVALDTTTTVSTSLSAHLHKLVTITNATPGSIAYSDDALTAGTTTIVYDPDSLKFGVTYTYTTDSVWVVTGVNSNFTPGSGLSLSGKILNVNIGSGITLVGNNVTVNTQASNGLDFDGSGKLAVKLSDSSLALDANGLKVASTIVSAAGDAVLKSGTNVVTGSVEFAAGSSLKVDSDPVNNTDATNKSYVDTQDALKVNKAGDTMTGQLVLFGDPTNVLGAATKQYVDSGLALKLDSTANAVSATKLQTARTINGTFFDGTVNITTNAWGTARNVTIGNTAKAVDGTADISWSLAEIGAAPAVHTHALSSLSDVSLVGLTAKQFIRYDGTSWVNVNLQAEDIPGLDASKIISGILDPARLSGTYNISISGNAATATNATHAASADVATTVSAAAVTGSPAVLVQASIDNIDYVRITAGSVSVDNGYLELATAKDGNEPIYIRQYSDNFITPQRTLTLLDSAGNTTLPGSLTVSGNIPVVTTATVNNYAPTLTGGGAIGNWAISISGNAATATKLQTARNINGTAFDGTADIVTATWGNSRNFTIGNTSHSVDGTANVSWSVTDIVGYTPVNKAGDTMTGALVLASNPTAALEAATKQYVDSGLALKLEATAQAVDSAKLGGQLPAYYTDIVSRLGYTPVNKAGDTMTGLLLLSGDPTAPLGAATKQYVDTYVNGLKVRNSVRLATTAALDASYNNGASGVGSTLTATANGALVIDTITPVAGDRVLVKDQTNKAENGEYIVTQVGSSVSPFILTRPIYEDESNEIPGSYFFVYDGVQNIKTGWVVTVDNPSTYVIGTNNIYINQFSGTGSIIAGDGLVNNGNIFNVVTASSSRIVVNPDSIDLATTGVIASTYNSVTVDTYGRVTAGTNPTTLSGYGITDAYTKTYIDTQLATKINKAGDTMTGILTLAGDPVANLDAATKQYVDNGLATKLGLTAKAADSDKLDGIDSTQFLRSDVDATAAGTVSFSKNIAMTNSPMLSIPVPDGGGYYSDTSAVTGAFKIQLPVSWTNAMLSFTVDIFNHTSDSSAVTTLIIGGYNYAAGSAWQDASVQVVSSKLSSIPTVRFGHDGTYCSIYIGETNSTWNSPRVQVRDVKGAGSGSFNISGLLGIWAVSAVTALGTITATVVPVLQATSASTLTTARHINGTLFDGSVDVTTATWGTTRNVTIGNTTKAYNGGADAAWSVTDVVGYTPVNKAGDTMAGLLTLAQDPSGNLDAATKQYVDSVVQALRTDMNTMFANIMSRL